MRSRRRLRPVFLGFYFMVVGAALIFAVVYLLRYFKLLESLAHP